MKNPDKLMDDINKQVAEFFGMPVVKPSVIIYKSRQEFVAAWSARNSKKQCPSWTVASTTFDGVIHIMADDIMPGTSRLTGQERYQKVIKHELAHIYTDSINKNTPAWLSEGVSCYIADQDYYKKYDKSQISVKLLNSYARPNFDSTIYGVGRSMVDLIINKYGKDELIELIRLGDDVRDFRLRKMFNWLS